MDGAKVSWPSGARSASNASSITQRTFKRLPEDFGAGRARMQLDDGLVKHSLVSDINDYSASHLA